MIHSLIELALVFERLGIEKDGLGDFSDRFQVQKKIYLAQIMGVDLNYRYGWYLHGPYSRKLTADAFSLKEDIKDGDSDFEKFNLQPEIVKSLMETNAICTPSDSWKGSNDDWLELLASLHYLKEIAYRPPEQASDFDAIFKELIDSKPQFTERKEEARLAWDTLVESDLLSFTSSELQGTE